MRLILPAHTHSTERRVRNKFVGAVRINIYSFPKNANGGTLKNGVNICEYKIERDRVARMVRKIVRRRRLGKQKNSLIFHERDVNAR
jgi:hypothetical protein